MYRSEDIGAGKQSAGRRVGRNFPSPMESFPWDFPCWTQKKSRTRQCIGVEAWDGSKKLGRVGDRPKKEFPDEKALRGRFALGLRKKSKATVYRSENIGAGKQSAGRRVGKNFPSPMESFPWQGCVFFGGVFFSAEKIKVPDEKIFHGISVAGLRKNFERDSASEQRHGAARKNLAGSAIGRGRRIAPTDRPTGRPIGQRREHRAL